MKTPAIAVMFLACCALALADSFPERELTLVGWGMNRKATDTFFANAKAVGFDVLITWSNDPVFLAKAADLGKKHGIKVFACLSPMGRIAGVWEEKHPGTPVPWQVMSEAEDAAVTFLAAGKNRSIAPFQWGGEPVMAHEVLLNKIICFSNAEARVLHEQLIDRIAAVPGIEGLALDGFGYQNYHSCQCARCKERLADYVAKHPGIPQEQASNEFYLDMLVGYINHLADYARSRRADIKTTIHIWPVLAPEPLYGNRLDLDYCGQTAAWYTLWPKEKIAEYSRIISRDANTHYPRQEGVGMIGYYDRPGTFPIKTAALVDMELTTMIENGCTRIQVCSASDVIANSQVAEVFKKHFGQPAAESEQPGSH